MQYNPNTMHNHEGNAKLSTLKISTIAIASVVIVEVFLGQAVGSLAILSDGAHALLDALTTFTLFLATRASLKPPDEDHMYGHEKFETIGGLVGGIVLIGVALLIIYEAVARILQGSLHINTELEYAGLIAIGYTFCIDFLRVAIFQKAHVGESSTIKAGFYHAIADLVSTLIALLGFGLAIVGIYYGDAVASIILSVMLTYMSIKLAWGCVMELSDIVPRSITEKVRDEISKTKGVSKYKNLRIRKAGQKIFAEATVQISNRMSLEEAHDLVSRIEENLKERLGNAEVTIHVEPTEEEVSTRRLVEKLATEVKGVRDAHEIDTVYTGGRLYITLHAQVDPKLSVKEAHEIAEEIERSINEQIKDVEHVTVHVEPSSFKLRKGASAYEGEINQIIRKTVEKYEPAVKIRKVVTYVADRKRYINIDCCFTKQISIEEAHEIVSKIESNVKEHFSETTVTVHMEEEASC
jgi:cation diffusion facilitator family transporter